MRGYFLLKLSLHLAWFSLTDDVLRRNCGSTEIQGGATSGRWTSNFWLDQAVFVHLPEVNKQPPLKSKRAEIVKIVLNENEPCPAFQQRQISLSIGIEKNNKIAYHSPNSEQKGGQPADRPPLIAEEWTKANSSGYCQGFRLKNRVQLSGVVNCIFVPETVYPCTLRSDVK